MSPPRRLSIRNQPPVHCGWLTKQGGLVKNWKPRWFLIRGDHVYYYQKEDTIKLLGDIPLPGNEVVELPSNPDEPGRYYFQIKPGKGRTYVNPDHAVYTLFAKNESDRQEWISCIHRVLYSHIGGGVFGQNVLETMNCERRMKTGRLVPNVVEQCILYIEQYGLQTEGIFRLPGAAGTIRRLKWEFNSAQPVNLDPSGSDIHSAASLLKLYLRELPEPVIPFEYYEQFTVMGLKIQWDPHVAMALLHDKMTQLPRDNYNLLRYLCMFLSNLCSNSDSNRMTESNIALMFGPNLLRTDDDNPMLMLSTADLTTLTVRTLIANFDEVFEKDYILSESRERVNLNSVDEDPFEVAAGESTSSSGVSSPVLSKKSPLLSASSTDDEPIEIRRKSNNNVDIYENKKSPTRLEHSVAFRSNSGLRDSRKKLRRFNILSEPSLPDEDHRASSSKSTTTSKYDTRSTIVGDQGEGQGEGQTEIKDETDGEKLPDVDLGYTDRVQGHTDRAQGRRIKIEGYTEDEFITAPLASPEIVPKYTRVDSSIREDILAQITSLTNEVEKLTKTQTNLGRIYQRQLDTQVEEVEQRYESQVETLNKKLDDEKNATLLSVERLIKVQAELEKYQMKYGPLESEEDDWVENF